MIQVMKILGKLAAKTVSALLAPLTLACMVRGLISIISYTTNSLKIQSMFNMMSHDKTSSSKWRRVNTFLSSDI